MTTRERTRKATTIAIMTPTMPAASTGSFENMSAMPMTTMNGTGSNISMKTRSACWIWFTSLVLRVMREATPNRPTSRWGIRWAFSYSAHAISRETPVAIEAET